MDAFDITINVSLDIDIASDSVMWIAFGLKKAKGYLHWEKAKSHFINHLLRKGEKDELSTNHGIR